MLERSEGLVKKLNIDRSWTLFLDRDGVINKKIDNDYIKRVDEFVFCEKAPLAIKKFRDYFGIIVVVTNQQGIGKKNMSDEDLDLVHSHMLEELKQQGAQIDKIYYCPELASDHSQNRKPNTGMALQAKKDFPSIDFQKSLMVGDSLSDIEFGHRLGMQKAYINIKPEGANKEALNLANFTFNSLWGLVQEF